MSYQETLTREIGDISGNIDAEKALSKWYGPDSLACHSLDKRNATGYFIVTENLCDVAKRPPLFDRLTYGGGIFKGRTAEEDAREHFIKSVGLKVVPGHNLAGLITHAAEAMYFEEMVMLGFDFMRYKGFVLPNQDLEISGPINIVGESLIFSPTIKSGGERKALGKNFRFEVPEYPMLSTLDIHWQIEAAAQAMGVQGISDLDSEKEIVPILMEVGKSLYENMSIEPGDILISRIEVLSADENMMSGNIEQSLLGGGVVSRQENMILLFAPLEEAKKKIQEAA